MKIKWLAISDLKTINVLALNVAKEFSKKLSATVIATNAIAAISDNFHDLMGPGLQGSARLHPPLTEECQCQPSEQWGWDRSAAI